VSDNETEHRLVQRSNRFWRTVHRRPTQRMAVRTERDNAPRAVEGFAAEPGRTFFLRIRNQKLLSSIIISCRCVGILYAMTLLDGGGNFFSPIIISSGSERRTAIISRPHVADQHFIRTRTRGGGEYTASDLSSAPYDNIINYYC